MICTGVCMLDLSCVDLSVEDMLQCSFGLSNLELNVLMELLRKDGWVGIAGLAASLGRDRSVVQRGLSSLMGKGLTEREQSNRDRGGYEYLYRAKDKKVVKRVILEKSKAFCGLVSATVKDW